ncbi:peptidase S24 [bacterium]|nr:peptidase S24 [bacterium]|tara:strand:+ start:298 stop:738 length:441 start_codon:yes stop_codon:yes gene_type:complete
MAKTPTKVTDIHGAAPDATTHPLYASQPAAGFPAPGDDFVERSLNIHDLVVKHPTATFFVRVRGDSMEGAGIYSGDVLVVDRSVEAYDGSIVVAAVYGELVVKRVRLQRNQVTLASEQAGYEPIAVNELDDCYVWGVVVGSVRQFT